MGKAQALETGFLLLKRTSGNFLPKNKINPKTFGWVRPDGVINFQTVEAAEVYAKNRCVAALQGAKPFERGVLVKDNQVLAEVNGTRHRIDKKIINKIISKMEGASFFHGHPDNPIKSGNAFPLSLSDYLVMVSNKLKKIVAFNKEGEYSSLTRKPQKKWFRLLPEKWQEKLSKFEQIGNGSIATSEYAKAYASIFPKEMQSEREALIHFQVDLPYGSRSKIKSLEKYDSPRNDKLPPAYKIVESAKENGTLARVINNFWEKVSKKVDCIYETNYSQFIKET